MSKWILLANMICILMQGYFSMMEMASISFNKLKLEYYLVKEYRFAFLLKKLLSNPTYFFGAILVGVNFFLQMGSELSRVFFIDMGWNPDFAPIMQIFVVVIFAELIPMTISRLYAERIVSWGILPIYFLSLILKPLIFMLYWFIRIFFKDNRDYSLSREDIQISLYDTKDNYMPIIRLFSIEKTEVGCLAHNLSDWLVVDLGTNGLDVNNQLKKKYFPFFFVYGGNKNVFGYIYSSGLSSSKLESQVIVLPSFKESTPIAKITKCLKHYGMILIEDDNGNVKGFIRLEDFVKELFGNKKL